MKPALGTLGTFVVVIVGITSACPAIDVIAPSVLPTGTTPNAVAVVRCEAGPRLLVAASAEGRLDVIDPAGVVSPSSIFLGVGSSPWDVAVVRHAEGSSDLDSRAVVTLVGSHGVALVRPCGDVDDRALIATVVDTVPFDLVDPVTLRQPEDVDGDGAADTVVTRMTPRTPQAVAVGLDGRIVVAFANLLAFATGRDEPMLAGPGLVSTFDVVDDALVLRSRAVVPCENPGGLAVDGDDVFVACAGRYAVTPTGHGKASTGAVVRVDGQGAIRMSTSLPTPGPVLVHEGVVVAGDLLGGTIVAFDSATLEETARVAGVSGTDGVIDSAFALVVDGDGTLVAGWFDGRVQRDPFGGGVVTPAPAGPGRGLVDLVHDGERLWGLHTLAAELVVIGAGP